YEQARGLRAKNETVSGYQISVTKTLAAPLASLFRAWTDDKFRRRWLSEPLTIRKATPHKSIRITWPGEGANIEVMFYPQPSGSNRVSVQHNKLPSKAAAEQSRAFWKARLEAMREALE